MKCIKRLYALQDGTPTSEIKRTTDAHAAHLVDKGAWSYTSKSAWKASGRKYLKRK